MNSASFSDEGRSGLIALLHRLGLEYHKPNVIPRKLDAEEKHRRAWPLRLRKSC